MNWGHSIILSFLLFGALIFTMVVISMNQDLNLVDGDYYNQELEYQDQIERIKNYSALTARPELTYISSTKNCVLKFPDPLLQSTITGKVHFFRPSDAAMDKKYTMNGQVTNGFLFDVIDLPPGLWLVKVTWTMNNMEYYFEKNITL
ncbi:MAG: FixH family protein [Cyclobacteriaceae bacterium]|nr:FixH family protein [Cyclobacteriaceae bacterium]